MYLELYIFVYWLHPIDRDQKPPSPGGKDPKDRLMKYNRLRLDYTGMWPSLEQRKKSKGLLRRV